MYFKSLIENRGLSVKHVSELSGIKIKKLTTEKNLENFKNNELKILAEILGVSEASFFSKNRPILPKLPKDFRTTKNYEPTLSLAALKAIYKTYEVMEFFETTIPYSNLKIQDEFNNYLIQDQNENDIQKSLKKIFSLEGKDLLKIGSPYKIFYFLRYHLERSGVHVICESVRDHTIKGFCSEKNGQRVVFINNEGQTLQARIFTLIHEVVHLIIGKPGIVDSYHTRKSLERFCNKLTAQFLLPEDICNELYQKHAKGLSNIDAVNELANHIPYSKYFLAIRLQETVDELDGIVTDWLSSVRIRYPKTPTTATIAKFTDRLNEQDVEEVDEDKYQPRHTSASYQVARLGFSAISLAQSFIQNNTVNKFDLQYYLNLPAKHQEKVFKSHHNKMLEVSKYGGE